MLLVAGAGSRWQIDDERMTRKVVFSTTLVDREELESARRSSACFASSRDACIYAYDVSFDKGFLVY